MEGAGVAAFIVLALVVGIGGWLMAMAMDKGRITAYVEERGGRVVSISWAPFGKGWFGDKNDRIYEVVYYDAEGRQHFATCKTSLFSGVYWTEDRVSHARPGWYDRAPRRNERHDPVIRHLPADNNEAIQRQAAEVPNSPPARPNAEAIDAEIARLRQRIAELERQKQEAEGYRAEPQ